MGWDVCTSSTPIARKDYRCEASTWIIECGLGEVTFTFAELRTIAKAKREGWKIKKGQRYFKCAGKWYGEWSTFRARQDMHELCIKYDLYQE